MVLLSFVDIQKIRIFTKFGGCSSKIEPVTPILILKFKRAWQTQFFSHTLQILVNDRFFIGHQMIFYSIFCISNRKAELWKKLLFLFLSSPQVVKNPMIMDYNYHLGATLKKKKQFFSNFSFPVTDLKNWLKYHLMTYIRSIIDHNLEGVAENLSLPHPFEVQNWNGRIGLNSWATPSKFCENLYLLEIYKW